MSQTQQTSLCKTRFARDVVSLWSSQDVVEIVTPTKTKNLLVFEVLQSSLMPMTATDIAKNLEVKKNHWWTRSNNKRVAVYQVLQRIKAVRHPDGFYTVPLPKS